MEYCQELLVNQETVIAEQETVIAEALEKMDAMAATIAKYQRMLFGQKRERFEYPNNQLSLPFEIEPEVLAVIEEAVAEKIEVSYTKQKSNHKGRLPLPDHLEVVETIIEPTIDTTDMVCIGEEITEELGYQAEKFFVNKIIRKKYAPKTDDGKIVIAPMPERVINKGIASAELLVQIMVDKYIDHLPLYRIRQRFARNKIDIKGSTIDSWVCKTIEKLEPLYDYLRAIMVAKGYLQVDETTLKVLDSILKGKTHLGYYWAYNSPMEDVLFFEYHKNREAINVNKTLEGFKGFLQVDGYSGYAEISKKTDVVRVACMAHIRRKFEESQENDLARSQKAMTYIQALYLIEAKIREEGLSPDQRKEKRLAEALPIFNAFGNWITDESKKVLPKSKIGQAMQYAINQWDGMTNYFMDGNIEIDNNKIENAIRPIALGRKNYLFAGSHEAAQRAAIIYTFFGICKKHNVNPTQWLIFALKNIDSVKINQIETLLPQNFKLIEV